MPGTTDGHIFQSLGAKLVIFIQNDENFRMDTEYDIVELPDPLAEGSAVPQLCHYPWRALPFRGRGEQGSNSARTGCSESPAPKLNAKTTWPCMLMWRK